ncbi:MAG: hypothetical protein ACRDTG_17700 [Pseudonocardiaceae bacterium]
MARWAPVVGSTKELLDRLLITHNTVLAEYWCQEVRPFADLRSRP